MKNDCINWVYKIYMKAIHIRILLINYLCFAYSFQTFILHFDVTKMFILTVVTFIILCNLFDKSEPNLFLELFDRSLWPSGLTQNFNFGPPFGSFHGGLHPICTLFALFIRIVKIQ